LIVRSPTFSNSAALAFVSHRSVAVFVGFDFEKGAIRVFLHRPPQSVKASKQIKYE
jgi:hypothetical protein